MIAIGAKTTAIAQSEAITRVRKILHGIVQTNALLMEIGRAHV